MFNRRDEFQRNLIKSIQAGKLTHDQALQQLAKFDARAERDFKDSPTYVYKQTSVTPADKESAPTIVYPHEIYAKLDAVVVSQTEAKKGLATAIAPYLTAINKNQYLRAPRIALIGPTGSGKTHLLKSLAGFADLDLIFINCSEYHGSGWHGTNLLDLFDDKTKKPEFIKRLKDKARKLMAENPNKTANEIYKLAAKQTVLVFDEFDKIARRQDEGNQDSSRAVMADYMNILEGRDVNFTDEYLEINASINTQDVPIVCLGAFVGLDELEQTKPFNGIGFGAEKNTDVDRLLKTNLHRYGFMPELLGRLTTFIKLKPLTKEDYIKILDLTVLPRAASMFNVYNIALKFMPSFKNELAEKATKAEEGARVLSELVEEQLRDYLFTAEEYTNSSITFEHCDKPKAVKELKTRTLN